MAMGRQRSATSYRTNPSAPVRKNPFGPNQELA
jgi:hypothetical protein